MKINKTNTIVESYSYDMFGNRIVTTDALGHAVYKSYDSFGRVTAEWGATYPVRFTFDTQGRRTSLATTRDGDTWDTTTWAYDPCTSLCLSKTYADGSVVTYTYTPDNLPLRTTYASGRWREYAYETNRRLAAETSGGGSGGAGGSPAEINTFAYDLFGNRLSESNSVSSVTYQRDTYGNCTNETTIVAGGPQSPAAAETYTIDREFDAHSRLVRHGDTYYTYAPDGLLATISNAEAVVEYAYTPDRLDAGYTLTLTNGTVFSRAVVRDIYRRSLVTAITNSVNGIVIDTLSYSYDALNRPITRNANAFGYNDRSEVVFSRGDAENAEDSYSYDNIGNLVNHVSNGVTNSYTANSLNQYTLRASAPPREFTYDSDGNLLSDGVFTYAYDAANRLSSVTSNGVLLVTNRYDAQSRRVKKVDADNTHRYFYDGWLLVRETLVTSHSLLVTDYFWGKDISGTRGGAAGIGGLLYVRRDGAIYVPRFDAYGNVRGYCDAQGNVVASYTYDAFGNTIAQSGPMAGDFALRSSTKYIDVEANLYYYGYRYYHPPLMRWLNRDPIEEEGGINLYATCENSLVFRFDLLGRNDASVVVEGLGAGWAASTITLKGKTAVQLNGELYYLTMTHQSGMRIPRSGPTSSLYLFKASNVKKGLRLDYHEIPLHSNNPPKWHWNVDGNSGIAKVTNSKSLNHVGTPKTRAFGKTVTVFKRGNRICFVAGIGMSVIDIYKADKHVREFVRQVGGWSGAYLGGRVGATVGAKTGMAAAIAIGQAGPQITTPEELVTVPVFGFVGGVGGGLVGGIVGGFFGTKTTETAYDWVFTPLEKEEWEVGCEQ